MFNYPQRYPILPVSIEWSELILTKIIRFHCLILTIL